MDTHTHTHTQLRDTVIDDVSTRDRLDLECVVREHKEYGWDSGMTIGQDIEIIQSHHASMLC